jgi:hypothetical protein
MRGLFKNIRFRPLGMALGVTVPLLVMLWHLLAVTGRSRDPETIVGELGGTMSFVSDPMPNHACTRLIFIQKGGKGHSYDVCFSSAPFQKKILFEQPISQSGSRDLDPSLMGWSPDDKLFAYGRRCNDQWEIVICDGHTGACLAVVPFNFRPPGAGWSLSAWSEAVWLSPELLAFSDSRRVLHAVRKDHDQWLQPQTFDCFRNTPPKHPGIILTEGFKGFSAFDADSVVWLEDGSLFVCGPHSAAPVTLWKSIDDNRVLEFSYSQTSAKFLVRCQDTNGPYLAYLYPQKRGGRIASVTMAGVMRIKPDESLPAHLSFINNGEGYAFLNQPYPDPDQLVIKPNDSHAATQFLWSGNQGRIKYFAAGDHAIYLISSLNDMPTGIWRYDLASATAECVMPQVPKYFSDSQNGRLTTDTITNGAGEKLTFYLHSTAEPSAKPTYPLVIGIPGAAVTVCWNDDINAFSDCGAFSVTIDRTHRDSSKWADDAFTVYKALAKRPDIDTNRIFLFADSAGTGSVFELLEQNPEFWHGAIMFGATSFPDPTGFRVARIFMDNGSDDSAFGAEGIKVPMRFQDKAAKAGIPVTLFLHPGEGHILIRGTNNMERVREALIFLDEN